MTDKEFPDFHVNPETNEGNVDFSDLGPLFAPSGDIPPEEEAQEEASVEFLPEEEEKPADLQTAEEVQDELTEDPEETGDSLPEEQEISFQPDVPEEVPTVDFSDLGPLFSAEPPAVQPGAAAMVLQKLRQMEPETAEALQEEDTPMEENSQEPVSREKITEPEFSPESAESSDPEEEDGVLQGDVSDDKQISQDSAAESDRAAADEEPENAPEAEENTQEAEEKTEEVLSQEEIQSESHEKGKDVPAWMRKKGRPKRKKGEGFLGIPNFLVTIVWIAVTVLIGVTLGRMAWLCASDVLAFGREDKPVTITVYEADTIEDITRKLHDGGLIKYPGLFQFYASLAVDEGEIHPGIWDLNTRYDYHALVNMMSPSSSREVIELMIPEGYSCRQIFSLMEENKICTALDLGSYAAAGDLGDYWFLEGVERGDMYCLEGYLFPDTYQFYKNDSPRNVLTKMLDNFQNKFDEAMVGQIDTLNTHLAQLMEQGGHGQDFIAQNTFTVQDVINVASLIEKETSSAEEGYVIASVIYNRLFNWPDNVPYLNIDATIVYALGGKTDLTPEDLKVNSPYNTYTHTGLTPGPIANPGLSSIRAALDPAESNYYYYVLDPALGSHRFSTTYDEHKANIASIGG